MSRGLDWKWIALGVLIMFGLSFVIGLVVAAFMGPELVAAVEGGEAAVEGGGAAVEGGEAAAEGVALPISGGQILLLAIINFLVFVLGGYIVGARSKGRTIIEPGISAIIAIAIGLLISGTFTLPSLLVGALIPFVGGVLGGWLGERQQGTA